MKAKEWLSTLLAMTMLLVLLAACSQNGSGNASSPSASAVSSGSQPAAEASKPVAVNLFAGTSSFNGNLETNWFTKYV